MRVTSRTFYRLSLAAMLLAGCSDSNASPTPPQTELSTAARRYLNDVLTLMQRNSVHRNTIDWADFRARVITAAGASQRIPETYPAIRLALSLLADDHSFYIGADGVGLSGSTKSCVTKPIAERPSLPPSIGYVRIRSFSGSTDAATAFAQAIQSEIRAGDSDGLIGWIVDLRGNGGGNMWPMLAGVGPILGEGLAGYFIDPNDISNAWGYALGASVLDGLPVQRVDGPYTLRKPAPRVAVLTDVAVASSGEAIAVAFRTRPNTRAFGTATCGLSTANSTYFLQDGARLILTVSLMADRTRTPYGVPLVPDEVLIAPEDVVSRAVAWLSGGA